MTGDGAQVQKMSTKAAEITNWCGRNFSTSNNTPKGSEASRGEGGCVWDQALVDDCRKTSLGLMHESESLMSQAIENKVGGGQTCERVLGFECREEGLCSS